MLNWIVWNRINSLALSNLQRLICHKTQSTNWPHKESKNGRKLNWFFLLGKGLIYLFLSAMGKIVGQTDFFSLWKRETLYSNHLYSVKRLTLYCTLLMAEGLGEYADRSKSSKPPPQKEELLPNIFNCNTTLLIMKLGKPFQSSISISVQVRSIQRWEVCNKSKIGIRLRTFWTSLVYTLCVCVYACAHVWVRLG